MAAPFRWILKTEPGTYAFAQLLAEGTTRWEGVRNAQALLSLRAMRKGDRALIYHSGAEKALVGTASIASAPYPDPAADDPRLVVVDVKAGRQLAAPVTLAQVKAERGLGELALVRQGRLSVMPVTEAQSAILARLAGV